MAAVVGLVNRIVRFFKEAVREVQKAQWPTRQELLGFTLVVVVAVGAVAFYIGVLDIVLSRVSRLWQPR